MRKRLWIVRWVVSERDFIDSHRVFMADAIYETSSASFMYSSSASADAVVATANEIVLTKHGHSIATRVRFESLEQVVCVLQFRSHLPSPSFQMVATTTEQVSPPTRTPTD